MGLLYTEIIEDGALFQTGACVTFDYTHRKQPHVDCGARFGQHIEPCGRYVTQGHSGKEGQHAEPSYNGKPFIVTTVHGSKTFENPLVLEWNGYGENGWKQQLSNHYDNKTGKALSRAIVSDGYDGVVTITTYKSRGKTHRCTGEIVDLTNA